MNKGKIPTILGIFILIIGLAAGVFLVQNKQIFRLGASPEISPKDVRISNVTESSFTVSWVTDKQVQGFISWGENPTSLNRTELNEIEEKANTHSVTVQGLSPNTTYYFKINSGGVEFDNNGLPWEVRTGAQLTIPSSSILVSGSVLTAAGEPAQNALVYINVAGANLLSTVTSQNGTWVINIAQARSKDLASFVQIDEINTLLEISTQISPQKIASAQIYPAAAKPAPPIIIGQTHDFKNLAPIQAGETPTADINLPSETTPSSSFIVPEEIPTPETEAVILESLKEGEVITTQKPEFFGQGPAGTTITITVESEAVTDQVTIGSSGSWRWTPPTTLEEGVHKITIVWKDANGITRTLTRNFIIQAAEGPAFEATPSATPTPTPSPTPLPASSPSPTPSPTTTSTPAPLVTATPTSSPSTLLDAGDFRPTLFYSVLGLIMIISSLILGVFSFKKT